MFRGIVLKAPGDVVIEPKDSECRIVVPKLTSKPIESIGGDAPALDEINDLEQRYR